MTIELDRAQTANAELDRLNDDLKRDNVEIKRQLDKWQNLETKDGVELDAMRKRRIELEVNVKELESRLSDAEEKEEADARVLENHKRKIEKLNDALTEWRVRNTSNSCVAQSDLVQSSKGRQMQKRKPKNCRRRRRQRRKQHLKSRNNSKG
jgi:chromosome segregation ATPase